MQAAAADLLFERSGGHRLFTAYPCLDRGCALQVFGAFGSSTYDTEARMQAEADAAAAEADGSVDPTEAEVEVRICF